MIRQPSPSLADINFGNNVANPAGTDVYRWYGLLWWPFIGVALRLSAVGRRHRVGLIAFNR
jgi:hypothetical protein